MVVSTARQRDGSVAVALTHGNVAERGGGRACAIANRPRERVNGCTLRLQRPGVGVHVQQRCLWAKWGWAFSWAHPPRLRRT